jgi:hypothetical protein
MRNGIPAQHPIGITVLILALLSGSIYLARGWLISDQFTLDFIAPSDRPLVEFLLLLPVAAAICCIGRNIVGLHTFGTFAPALLGLAFRDVDSPVGLFVLIIILSLGWIARRGVNSLNLLQVPRSGVMLTVVVSLLLLYILWSNSRGQAVARSIPFLPMVIVTGLIERFWSAEEEDGTSSAVRTMFSTLLMAVAIFWVLRHPTVYSTFIHYPELLGLIVALQILIGRYTGYRVTELFRFRGLANSLPAPVILEERITIPARRW